MDIGVGPALRSLRSILYSATDGSGETMSNPTADSVEAGQPRLTISALRRRRGAASTHGGIERAIEVTAGKMRAIVILVAVLAGAALQTSCEPRCSENSKGAK